MKFQWVAFCLIALWSLTQQSWMSKKRKACGDEETSRASSRSMKSPFDEESRAMYELHSASSSMKSVFDEKSRAMY